MSAAPTNPAMQVQAAPPDTKAKGMFTFPLDVAEYQGLHATGRTAATTKVLQGPGLPDQVITLYLTLQNKGAAVDDHNLLMPVIVGIPTAEVKELVPESTQDALDYIDSIVKTNQAKYSLMSGNAERKEPPYPIPNETPVFGMDAMVNFTTTHPKAAAMGSDPNDVMFGTKGTPFPTDFADQRVLGATLYQAFQKHEAFGLGIPMFDGFHSALGLMSWAYSCMALQCSLEAGEGWDSSGASGYWQTSMGWHATVIERVFNKPSGKAQGPHSAGFKSPPREVAAHASKIASPYRYSLGTDANNGGEITLTLKVGLSTRLSGIAIFPSRYTAVPVLADTRITNYEESFYQTYSSKFGPAGITNPVDTRNVLFIPFTGSATGPVVPPGVTPGDDIHVIPPPPVPGGTAEDAILRFAPPVATNLSVDGVVSGRVLYGKKPLWSGVIKPDLWSGVVEFRRPEVARDSPAHNKMALFDRDTYLLVDKGPLEMPERVDRHGQKVEYSGGETLRCILVTSIEGRDKSYDFSMMAHELGSPTDAAMLARTSKEEHVHCSFTDHFTDDNQGNQNNIIKFEPPSRVVDFGHISPGVQPQRKEIYVIPVLSTGPGIHGRLTVTNVTKGSAKNAFDSYLKRDRMRQSLKNSMEVSIGQLEEASFVIEVDPTFHTVGRLEGRFKVEFATQDGGSDIVTYFTVFANTGDGGDPAAQTQDAFAEMKSYSPGFFHTKLVNFRRTRSPYEQYHILAMAFDSLIMGANHAVIARMNALFHTVAKSLVFSRGSAPKSVQPMVAQLRDTYEMKVMTPLKQAGIISSETTDSSLSIQHFHAFLTKEGGPEVLKALAGGQSFAVSPEFTRDTQDMMLVLQLVIDAIAEGNKTAESRAMHNYGSNNYADRPEWGRRALMAATWAMSQFIERASTFRNSLLSAYRQVDSSSADENKGAGTENVWLAACESVTRGGTLPSLKADDLSVPRGFITASERAQQIQHYLSGGVYDALPYIQGYSTAMPLGPSDLRRTAGVYDDLWPLFMSANMPMPGEQTYPTPGQSGQANYGQGSNAPYPGADPSLNTMMGQPSQGDRFKAFRDASVTAAAGGTAHPEWAGPAPPKQGYMGQHSLGKRPAHWHTPNMMSVEMEEYRRFWNAHHRSVEAARYVPLMKAKVVKRRYRKRAKKNLAEKKLWNKDPMRAAAQPQGYQRPQDQFQDRGVPRPFRMTEGWPQKDNRPNSHHTNAFSSALF